jgi:hypothetical protein
MTLVIARLKDGIISAVSDTAVTFNEEAYRPERQVPKLCILSPDLAVGFAGIVESAVEALNEFPSDCKTYKAITDYFLEIHNTRSPETDFLLLFNKPVPKIVKVAHRKLEHPHGWGWIGYKPGYDLFQKLQLAVGQKNSIREIEQIYSTHPERAVSLTGRLIYGLRRIIHDHNIPSIGGFCIALNNKGGSFRYWDYGVVLGPSGTIAWPNLEVPNLLQVKEVNSYSVACFVSGPDDSTQAVAFHFIRAKVTFIYYGPRGEAALEFQ